MEFIITQGNEIFDAVSTERIREELNKMFSHNWLASFRVLDEFRSLNLIQRRGIWFKPTREQP